MEGHLYAQYTYKYEPLLGRFWHSKYYLRLAVTSFCLIVS